MTTGKNAKKRAARHAFHAATNDTPGAMPYSFKVVEYRRADDMVVAMDKPVATYSGMVRRVLTFASITSYKEYRERFFSCNPTGQLLLASPNDETVSDTRGQAFRSKVINQGADTSKAKPKAIVKGIASQYGVKGKRFDKASSEYEALQSIERDKAKALAISKEDVRLLETQTLHDIRQKYRKV